jgi:hypothetical protein
MCVLALSFYLLSPVTSEAIRSYMIHGLAQRWVADAHRIELLFPICLRPAWPLPGFSVLISRPFFSSFIRKSAIFCRPRSSMTFLQTWIHLPELIALMFAGNKATFWNEQSLRLQMGRLRLAPYEVIIHANKDDLNKKPEPSEQESGELKKEKPETLAAYFKNGQNSVKGNNILNPRNSSLPK